MLRSLVPYRFVLTVTSVFLFSCSSDPVLDSVLEDSNADEMEEPIDEPEVLDDSSTGSIAFEDDFVLEEDRRLANLVLSETDYGNFIAGEGDLKMVTQKVYQFLEDDFDFIIILSVEATQPPDLFYGRSTSVQNQVEGLGGATFNGASSYGSPDRLKSIIYMPRSEYIKSGPFLHEIAHTWANKGFLPTTVGGHWGYASTAGQLGGFDELVELGSGHYKGRLNGNEGFGTFANGGNSVPYGNLELYLMGLIPPDDLGPIQVAINPEKENPSSNEFTADAIAIYTAENLIAEHGERDPSYSNSQKAFKALTVIISTEPLSQDKIDAINFDLENFSRPSDPDDKWGSTNNFWRATQGKASFDFTVVQESIK